MSESDIFESDDFDFEDYILSDLPIKYYAEIVQKEHIKNPSLVCCQCKNELTLENLFLINSEHLTCNLCLPLKIQLIKAQRKGEIFDKL